MKHKNTILKFVMAICGLVIAPSLIRTFGIYSHDIYRAQQYLGGDKVTHMLIGGTLAAVFLLITPNLASIRKVLIVCSSACLVLIAEECFQLLTPRRHFEFEDMLWGLLGVFITLVISLVYMYSKSMMNAR